MYATLKEINTNAKKAMYDKYTYHWYKMSYTRLTTG